MELTREQIKEGNDKLAKLLGWFQEEIGVSGTWYVRDDCAQYVIYSIHNNYPHRDLPFHRDWNYLMKVVDKLGTIVYREENWKDNYAYQSLFVNIWQKWLHKYSKDGGFNMMNDLTSVWSACVAYLEWWESEETQEYEEWLKK